MSSGNNKSQFIFFYSSSTQTHEWIYWKSIVIVWTNNLIGAHELLDGSHLSPNRIEIPYSLDSFTSPRRVTTFISGVSFFSAKSFETNSFYIHITDSHNSFRHNFSRLLPIGNKTAKNTSARGRQTKGEKNVQICSNWTICVMETTCVIL